MEQSEDPRMIEAWKKEQHAVAAQVVVVQDDEDSSERLKVLTKTSISDGSLYGGLDVSFPKDQEKDQSVATYVVVSMDSSSGELKVVYRDYLYFHLTVPYMSSFLAFREIDPMVSLVKKQISSNPSLKPCAILVDGNGVFHKRRAGIACFVGIRLGIPSIGVGKTLYCEDGLTKEAVSAGMDASIGAAYLSQQWLLLLSGAGNEETMTRPAVLMDTVPLNMSSVDDKSADCSRTIDREAFLEQLPPISKGYGVKLADRGGSVLACALIGHGSSAKRRGTKNPIFVSVGHDMSLEEATSICAELSIARIPEPIRQADLWGRELLRDGAAAIDAS